MKIDQRVKLNPAIEELKVKIDGPGELNYVITKLILHAWNTSPNYAKIASITGVLSNVESEFYRRVVAEYEEQKKNENGDVYR